jgi:hypothetical protein
VGFGPERLTVYFQNGPIVEEMKQLGAALV